MSVPAGESSSLELGSMKWGSPVEEVAQVAAEPRTYDERYKIPVLMYHDIGEPASGLTVTPAALDEQMAVLVSRGFETASTEEFLLAMQGKPAVLPEKGIIVTFDDGYEAVFKTAYPILKEHGFTATVFVITDLVGKKGYLTWDQIEALARDGWVIGSHAVHHWDLRLLSEEKLKDEVSTSREVLREKTGQAISSFCYPSGKYNSSTVEAVKAAGYLGAFTTEPGIAAVTNEPYAVRRLRIDGREGIAAFKAKLQMLP